MSSTLTLADALDQANPNTVSSALQQVKLGTMLTPMKYVSGTIDAVAAVPLDPPALIIMSARVVTSGTGASVGTYIAGDSAVTPLLPPGGASTAVGIAAMAADGSTITFPNTVTSVIVTYIPRSDSDITAAFAPAT